MATIDEWAMSRTGGSYASTMSRGQLDAFKRQWPCHGLPDNLWRITFSYESNGDLVDIDARARNGRWLDSAAFDGPALVAPSDGRARRALRPDHATLRDPRWTRPAYLSG